jgi:hypothetical protein
MSGTITGRNAAGAERGSIGIEVSVDPFGSAGKSLRLTYTHTDVNTDEKTSLDYRVGLVTTPCNFGGSRYWFLCPLVASGQPCGRRVGKLYLPPGAKYFGCRNCWTGRQADAQVWL